jgi:hypothetical protein
MPTPVVSLAYALSVRGRPSTLDAAGSKLTAVGAGVALAAVGALGRVAYGQALAGLAVEP